MKSLAGALLLASILACGLQARHFIWPEKAPARNLLHERASEPLTGELATAKDATPAATPSAAPPVATSAPKRSVKNITHAATGGSAVTAKTTRTSLPVVPSAMLDIEVEHKFAEAHLSIWVDDQLTYTHVLEGTDKKHLVVFHQVQGHEFHAVPISPGKHLLRVQVASAADSYDQSGSVAGEFASGKENMLRITFSKHSEMQLNLQ